MSPTLRSKFLLMILLLFFSFQLAGCRRDAPLPLPGSPTATTSFEEATPLPSSPEPVVDTPTPELPSPTPEPVAFRVNGEPVLLAEFQAEMALFLDSGIDAGEQAETIVLDEMINQVLLAQNAFLEGFQLDEAGLKQRLEALAIEAGGQGVLDEWMDKYGYSPQTFESVFARAVAAAWMRDLIIEAVPERIEQVRVSQLIFNSSSEAEQALAQIRAGTSFASLALRQDPIMGGDLGWFPRGYLQEDVLDEAAYNLQTGEFSEVIQTSYGYHILLLVEHDPQRNLEQDARLILQEKALLGWLEEQRSLSDIEISLP